MIMTSKYLVQQDSWTGRRESNLLVLIRVRKSLRPGRANGFPARWVSTHIEDERGSGGRSFEVAGEQLLEEEKRFFHSGQGNREKLKL